MLELARRWLFPVACLGCGRPGVALCPQCAPGPDALVDCALGDLRVTALAPYDGLWRRAIVAFKSGERAYADAFAGLLRERRPPEGAIVPVTTTRRRRAARGFDQSTELARRYAGADALDILHKGGGPAQRGRGRSQRLALRGRFVVGAPHAVTGRRIVLLDDVCTTGATLLDAARAVHAAGGFVAGALVLAIPVASRPSWAPATLAHPARRNALGAAWYRRVARRGCGMKAVWQGKVVAESDDTVVVENNHYFPEGSIKREFFKGSETHSVCPWKGTASYYTLEVDGQRNPDAAWYYPEPKDAAKEIKDRVAFWKGVEVSP